MSAVLCATAVCGHSVASTVVGRAAGPQRGHGKHLKGQFQNRPRHGSRSEHRRKRTRETVSCEAPVGGNWEHSASHGDQGASQGPSQGHSAHSSQPPSMMFSQTSGVSGASLHNADTLTKGSVMASTLATQAQPASDHGAIAPATDDGQGGSGGPPRNDDGQRRWGDGEPPSRGRRLGPLALLLRGVRGRLEADPYFGTKLLIECGLDAAIITGANLAARKERFWRELEFTFCHLAISLLSDFGLVYLLAPSTTRPPPVTGSLRARLKLNLLPAHVFQVSPVGKAPFTVKARFATLLLKGVQYGAIGLGMGALGALCVHGLIYTRETFDPTFEPPKKVQSVLGTGAVWSGFMATSSNMRYNALTALEDAMWLRGPAAGKVGSFVLRLANNWAGASQWVRVTSIHNIEEDWIPRNPRE